MSISGLINVIKENESSKDISIFPFEHSIIFTNGHFLVRNDPNLSTYFGSFLLDRLLRDSSAYILGVERGRIKFLYERQPPEPDRVKQYLEVDVTKLELLDPTEKLEGETHGMKSYTLSKNGRIISVVRKLYFDYLSSISYDVIGADLRTGDHPIYFKQDKRIRSVCMPLRP